MRYALDYLNKSGQNDNVKLREIKLEKETISRPLDTPLARKKRKKKDSRIDISNDWERGAICQTIKYDDIRTVHKVDSQVTDVV